jgi:predicted lipoprotein
MRAEIDRGAVREAVAAGTAAPASTTSGSSRALVKGGPWLRLWLALHLLAAPSCYDSTRRFDRKAEALDGTATVVIVPSLAAFADATAALESAAADLEQAPAAPAVEAARDAWRAARATWNRLEPCLFGPPEDQLVAFKIDDSPADTTRIEQELAGAATLDAGRIESLGSRLKGFLAIEYLLFHPTQGGDALLVAADAARRRAYVRAVAENLHDLAVELVALWDPAGQDLLGEFVGAGRSSPRYATVDGALDDLVNRILDHLHLAAEVRIAVPLGRKDDGVPQPHAVETALSDNAIADVLDDLAGVEALYFCRFGGSVGASIDAAVRALAPDVADRMAAAIARARADLEALPGPLEDAVIADPARVEAAFSSLIRLRRVVQFEVAGVLGSTLLFSDFDGD